MMKKWMRILGVVWGGWLAAGTGSAQISKLAPDLAQLLNLSNLFTTVIVQYQAPPTSLDILTLQLLGGVVKQTFSAIPAVLVQLPAINLLSVVNILNVVYVSPDRSLAGMLDNTPQTVNAPAAWQLGYDGTGIGVAVIDSGIANHPDLYSKGVSRVIYRQSFNGSSQTDLFGHGTHVAGIIAGNGLSSTGPSYTKTFKGIAPNVNLIDLRVLDQSCSASDSMVIAAVQQAIALKSKYNIRVINLSLGRPVYESYHFDPLCRAVQAAWKAGITVVVAAGNMGRNGYATITSPGNTPQVITVGAMKNMGTPGRTDD